MTSFFQYYIQLMNEDSLIFIYTIGCFIIGFLFARDLIADKIADYKRKQTLKKKGVVQKQSLF